MDPESVIVMPFNVLNVTVWDIVALTGCALMLLLGIAQESKIKRLERRLNEFIGEPNSGLDVKHDDHPTYDGAHNKVEADSPNNEP